MTATSGGFVHHVRAKDDGISGFKILAHFSNNQTSKKKPTVIFIKRLNRQSLAVFSFKLR